LHISKLSTAILFVSVFFYVDVSVQFPVLMLAIEVQFITFFGAGFERYVWRDKIFATSAPHMLMTPTL